MNRVWFFITMAVVAINISMIIAIEYRNNQEFFKLRSCVNFDSNGGVCILDGAGQEKMQCLFTYDKIGFRIQTCEKI